MEHISLADFERVHVRVGRVIEATAFPEARMPAYVLRIDFGQDLGIMKTSARLTTRYAPDELVDRLVVAVTNVAPMQIGPLMSTCRVLGFPDRKGDVVLCVPDTDVPLGARLF